MTAGDPLASGEAQAYFHEIERVFVRLRGAPLLLSPADWQVARRWYQEGVPLTLVTRTLEEVFARRAEREATGAAVKSRISSLRYCAPAVDAAWEEQRAFLAPGLRALDEATRLDGDSGGVGDLATRLGMLARLLPDAIADVAVWRQRIVDLAAAASAGSGARDPALVEDQLRLLDEALLAAAGEGLDASSRAELDAELRRLVAGLRQRLPAGEVARARLNLERQLLRRRLALPLLSLFA